MSKFEAISIERIKHTGQVRALKEEIDKLKYKIKNDNWHGIIAGNNFCRLGEAINDAEEMLKEIRVLLDALQEIEPENV